MGEKPETETRNPKLKTETFKTYMMKSKITFIAGFLILFCSCHGPDKSKVPVRIIFDTDLGPDYDDVGALAFLHAMADSGEARDPCNCFIKQT